MTDGFVCIFHILIDAFFTCSTHYWERRLAISNHTCGLILFSVLLVFTSCILKILSHTHTFTTVTSWFQQSDFYETLRGFSSCFFSLGFVELLGPVSSEFSLNLKTFQPFLLQIILLTCSFLQYKHYVRLPDTLDKLPMLFIHFSALFLFNFDEFYHYIFKNHWSFFRQCQIIC